MYPSQWQQVYVRTHTDSSMHRYGALKAEAPEQGTLSFLYTLYVYMSIWIHGYTYIQLTHTHTYIHTHTHTLTQTHTHTRTRAPT